MKYTTNQDVDLFNVGEAKELGSRPETLRLSRFPSSLEPIYTLELGKHVSRSSTGCEVRFVLPEGDDFQILLSCSEPSKVHLFQGYFWRDALEMEPGRDYYFKGSVSPDLLIIQEAALPATGFSQRVMRLRVESGTIYFGGVDTFGRKMRPPRENEQPRHRWLAYGSSITQSTTYGYIFQAANRLGVDVLNKGLSGSCGVEPEVADWLVNHNDWDFATCEWGVNLRTKVTPGQFEDRVRKSLEMFLRKGKPVFLITCFLNHAHLDVAPVEVVESQIAFDDILRKVFSEYRQDCTHLHLLEGRDILRCPTWLISDLVHLTHDGHNRMGEALSGILKKHLGKRLEAVPPV